LATEQQCSGPLQGAPLHLDLDAEALLECPPRRERLGEEHAGIDRHDPHAPAGSLVQAHELVEQHGLLLLEGAQQHRLGAMAGRLAQSVRETGRRVEGGGALCHLAI
jgi:hypothetical protein